MCVRANQYHDITACGKTDPLPNLKFPLALLASEQSERDTLRGNTIDNRGCLFVYIYIWTYVCHFVL